MLRFMRYIMHAIVIGGTSGFGKNISDALKRAGYEVTTTGRVGGDFTSDVGDKRQWEDTIKTISEEREPAAVVILVAGFARIEKNGHDDRAWEEHEQKNVGYVRQALEHLKLSDDACVITIGSQWSWKRGMQELAPYIESKHALRELTEEYAKEHPKYSVGHLCPPAMRTEQRKETLKSGYLPPNNDIADPAVIAESMVNQILTTEFHGETVQYDIHGEAETIGKEMIETEPRYEKHSKI